MKDDIAMNDNTSVKKNTYSREIVTSILGIMILILTLFSVSYAVFVKSFEGQEINSITTSYLTLSGSNSDNFVNLVNISSISDAEGKTCFNECREFEFIISNSSLNEMNYDIIISEINSNIDLKYLKVYLVNGEGLPLYNDAFVLSDLKNDGSLNGKNIYNGKISSGDEKVKLRVWVSGDYVDNNPVSLSFKMNVKGYI